MSENDGVICKNCGAKMLLTSDTCPSCHAETPRHKYIAKVEKGIRSDKVTEIVFIILLLIKLPCFVLGKLGAGKDNFDVPEKVYNGKWKGIHVAGDKLSVKLLKIMGIKKRDQLLKIKPIVDTERRALFLPIDEVKLSNADIDYSDFLLPQWQYDELSADDDDDFPNDEV